MNNQINQMMTRAVESFHGGNFDQTEVILTKILEIQSKNFDALQMMGVVKGIKNQHLDALELFKKALKIDSNNSFLHFNIAKAFSEIGEAQRAIKYHLNATKLNPSHIEGWVNYGKSLLDLNRPKEALDLFIKAIDLNPQYAEAWTNRGVALLQLKSFEEALLTLDEALKIKPRLAEAWSSRGNALNELKRVEEAIASYDRAIEIKPDFANAYNNRGNALNELKRVEEAIASYDRAIEIKPRLAEAWSNRGNALNELKRVEEAIDSYYGAIEIKPDHEYLFGTMLHTKMFICDWQNFETDVQSLSLKINEGKKSSPSFPVLSLIDSLSIQRKASEIWIKDKHPINLSLGLISKYQKRNKVRIGYYSADFHNHATAYLMAELFERHDKNSFELIAFSFGPDKKDEMRQRLSKAFDQFVDVRLKSDRDIALMSRDMEIDVAVDLKGFTKDVRTGIFSYRAAPIQVNYIGYPGTMAAEYIDYIISDPTLIPIESQQHYSEKVVYLPNSYQVNDRQRLIADKVFTKEELGLPSDSFVFCCFNNNYKITPDTFDGWVRILKAVEGSVLWLLEDNPTAGINLRKEAQGRGIDPNRLVFAKRMRLPEHLARHRVADLFIDTLPYNAHTTASDALWAGLPMLTCMGESFASRVAASLLNAIELPELIATTQEQYEATAIELAANPEKLKAIKDKLEKNILTTALFDTPRFTKHIEAAYTQMYERYQADLPSDHIYIED